MSEKYIERFPGASIIMALLMFAIIFGMAAFFDPNFTNFNDEDGVTDFMWVIALFIFCFVAASGSLESKD